MPSLHELQLGMMQAVLDGEPDRAARWIASRGISPTQALNVYANTARSNFTESLISSYPAVRRLVGEDYFLQAARVFHRGQPSTSGDLQPAGTRFAQYLSQLHGNDEYRYLAEVARLEWLIQETLLAADHAPLDLDKLGLIAPAAYDQLRFDLHPSARLFASQFPCVAIWQANVGSDAEPEPIDLGSGPDRVLLVRSGGELKFHRVNQGEQAFLQSLRAGDAFAEAVQSGQRWDAAVGHAANGDAADDGTRFDAAAALQRFVAAGVIVDFHQEPVRVMGIVTRAQ
jgi:hypothetical protein